MRKIVDHQENESNSIGTFGATLESGRVEEMEKILSLKNPAERRGILSASEVQLNFHSLCFNGEIYKDIYHACKRFIELCNENGLPDVPVKFLENYGTSAIPDQIKFYLFLTLKPHDTGNAAENFRQRLRHSLDKTGSRICNDDKISSLKNFAEELKKHDHTSSGMDEKAIEKWQQEKLLQFIINQKKIEEFFNPQNLMLIARAMSIETGNKTLTLAQQKEHLKIQCPEITDIVDDFFPLLKKIASPQDITMARKTSKLESLQNSEFKM